jgi:hypothetical protein
VGSSREVRDYIAKCEARKGLVVLTVTKSDRLALGCMKLGMEAVSLDEDDGSR